MWNDRETRSDRPRSDRGDSAKVEGEAPADHDTVSERSAPQSAENAASADWSLAEILRRRWWIVIAVPLLFATLAVVLTITRDESFKAEATVLLRSSAADDLFERTPMSLDERNRFVLTESVILETPEMRETVRRTIGGPVDYIAVPGVQTDLIGVQATASNAEKAALVANTAAQTYIDRHRGAAVDELNRAAKEFRARIAELGAELDTITVAIDKAGANATEAQRVERSNLTDQLGRLRAKLSDAELLMAVGTAGASLRMMAQVPDEPVGSNVAVMVLFGAASGLVVASLIVLLCERRRRRYVCSVRDVYAVVPQVPVLGTVIGGDIAIDGIATRDESDSVRLEQFRLLHLTMARRRTELPTASVQIAAVDAGESAAFVTANLAATIAASGARVALADLDLRNPAVTAPFPANATGVLADALGGAEEIDNCLAFVDGYDHFTVARSGDPCTAPAGLLAGDALGRVIAKLANRADCVLVASPPVLVGSDAALLAATVGQAVLVVQYRRTTREGLRQAVALLRGVGAEVVGVIAVEPTRRRKAKPGRPDARKTASPTASAEAGKPTDAASEDPLDDDRTSAAVSS